MGDRVNKNHDFRAYEMYEGDEEYEEDENEEGEEETTHE